MIARRAHREMEPMIAIGMAMRRAGRGDDQDREEANGISSHGPGDHGDRQRDRRVDGTQAIPEPAQRRSAGCRGSRMTFMILA